MKRNIILSVVALLLASCVKEGDLCQAPAETEGIHFSAVMENPDSRLSMTDSDTAIKCEWAIGDMVGMYVESDGVAGGANIKYSSYVAGPATHLFPEHVTEAARWMSETAGHTFYAYYPYAEGNDDVKAVKVSLPLEQKYLRDEPMSELEKNTFIYAVAKDVKKLDTIHDELVPLQFKHLFSVLELHLTLNRRVRIEKLILRSKSDAVMAYEGATIDLTTGELNTSGATTATQAVLNADYITPQDGHGTLRMLMPAGHGGDQFEIIAVINGKEYPVITKTVPAGGIEAGTTAVVKASLTVDEEAALVTVNLSEKGTANTYYVSKGNEVYRFRVDVKGNGQALDYHGITYSVDDLKIEPKSVMVLWYSSIQTGMPWKDDCPILMETLCLEDGYAYFDVHTKLHNGNVVIMALDKEIGYDEITVDDQRMMNNVNVLWSWNIVCSDGYNPDTAPNNINVGGYTMMGRDLGALIDFEDAVASGYNAFTMPALTGNLYQYGRKDPRPHIPDYGSAATAGLSGLCYTGTFTPIVALQYAKVGTWASIGRYGERQLFPQNGRVDRDESNPEQSVGDVSYEMPAGTRPNFAENIAITVSQPHLWMNGKNDWNHWLPNVEITQSIWGSYMGENGVKTIYDPCPVGWKVAHEGVWTELLSGGSLGNLRMPEIGRDPRGFLYNGNSAFFFNGGMAGGNGSRGGYISSCGAECPAAYLTSGSENAYNEYFRLITIYGRVNYYGDGGDKTPRITLGSNANSSYGASVRCMKQMDDLSFGNGSVGGSHADLEDDLNDYAN